MGTLDGKTAIVTGAASGIGRATAEALAREGASVLLTDIDSEAGEKAANAIRGSGGKAKFMQQDVTDEARWGQVVDEAKSEFGALHILVNNAGIGTGQPVTEMTLAFWENMMAINVDGVFLGCKHAIPAMREAGSGSIINLSSIAGIMGAPGLTAYNAAKGAVRLFTKGVAREVAADNIRVNSVHPGIIKTAIWNKMDESLGGALPKGEGGNDVDVETVAMGMAVPVGHAGTPEQIADGIVFLASDKSSYMTGAELVIDGGRTC